MPDKPGHNKNAEENPQESMPDSKKPADDTKPSKDTESEDSDGETEKDRTAKQFEKLKRHNKELAEKVRHLQGGQRGDSVFDLPGSGGGSKTSPARGNQSQQISETFSHLNQRGVEQEMDKIVDENGLVDVELLNKKLNDANQRAMQAEQRTNQVVTNLRKMEENQELNKAYEEYPELNPRDDGFDSEFFDLVRDVMVGQMARGERDLLKAAKSVGKHYKDSKKEGNDDLIAEKKKEAEKIANQARQANATGGGSNIRKTAASEMGDEELVRAVQRNQKGALAEMIRRHENT